ncbi:MAG: glycosyl hydrolase [Candidatus Acidiferrales bacterium]
MVFAVTIITASCAGVVGTPNSSPNQASQTISLSPPTPSVRAGDTQQFAAAVVGASNPQLTWSVNGIAGGNSDVGVISNKGTLAATYTAPANVPAPAGVTIKATVASNASIAATATANLLNPIPQLFSVSPSKLTVGAFTLTLSGASFANGAVVNFGTSLLTTNFVSATELTASGTATTSEVGNVQISVTNPNPGSASSSPLTAQVMLNRAQAPQISVSPAAANVPTGGIVDVRVAVFGSPAPQVTCVVNSAGTAQLSGSIVTYAAPSVVPEGGQATITCTAANEFGSASTAVIANISTVIPEKYAGPIPSTYFGMHIIGPYDWPTVPIGSLGKVTGVEWAYVEATKGQFNWSRLDQFVDLANAHGIGLMYSNVGVPPWAAADQSTCHPQPYFGPYCSGTVSNLQDWDEFVTELVTRYKGRIQTYELWNEPEIYFTGTMDQFVVLTQHEHDIIRLNDPAATILSPSMVSEGYAYLDDYFATGGSTDVDAVAIHTYPDPSNVIAETVTQSLSITIKRVMTKYGLSAKPIWSTEGSWGSTER